MFPRPQVCQKVFGEKRKAFDSKAARVAGTEAAKYVNKPPPRAGGRGGAAAARHDDR